MRILYLSQYFPPEVGATQTRSYEMAFGLVKAGHEVTLIAEVPNHPHGIISPEYQGKWSERSNLDGIDVIRVWVKTSPEKNFRTRMAFYISFMLMAIWAGLFLARGRYDAIYATSPPLFVGGAALALGYLRRIPLVFEVRDLWPESAVMLGELRSPQAVKAATWLEKACYRRASRIVVVTQGIRQRLLERGYPAEDLIFIPNGANAELFYNQPQAALALRQKLGLEEKFLALFAGLHGLVYDLETILEAAEILADKREFHFLFVGEGPAKENIVKRAAQMGLSNVTFHPQVSRLEVPVFFSAADVALVTLRRLSLLEGARPVRMFDAWACETPALVSADGEARQLVEQCQAGLYVEPESPEKLVDGLVLLHNNPTLRQEMGRNGRQAVIANHSRQAQARQLSNLLVEVLAREKRS